MSRRPNLIPTQQLNVALPLPVYTKITAYLYSELEQRVPLGAYQRLIVQLINEHFDFKLLDLAPYVGGSEGEHVVSGPPETIAALKARLERSL